MLKSIWREPEVWALAVAETIVWAGMFYLFAALISQWESDLGWSKTELAVGLTTCMLVSAVVSPFVGGLIDKGQGRKILSGGALLGGVLLALLACIDQQWQFILIWAMLGVASACCFYEPCFAYITHCRRDQAKGVITLVTLIAGFAGTLAFPVANFLSEFYHWRVAVGFFSGLIISIAVPLFLFASRNSGSLVTVKERAVTTDTAATRPLPEQVTSTGQGAIQRQGALRQAMSGWTFWLVALAFGLMAFNHSSLITHFLPLMEERGVTLQLAVLAASLIGPMQVLGRIIVTLIEPWASNLLVCGLSFTSLILSAIFLMLSAVHPTLIFGFVIFQGMGIGVSSIMRPLIVAELLGYRGFGSISGAAASLSQLLTAAAPTVAAAIWVVGGYKSVLFVMLSVAILATAVYILSIFSHRQGQSLA